MKVQQVYRFIDSIAPFATAESWDNVGLLAGDPESEVTGILTALDITMEVLAEAEKQGINLLVSHHPIIFDPIKSVIVGTIPYEAAKRGISIICAHTNYDLAPWGINQVLAELLELESIEKLTDSGPGCVGRLKAPMTPAQLAAEIEKKLGLRPRYNPSGRNTIISVGLCAGSGAGLMLPAMEKMGWQYEAFITADVKHDEYITAGQHGITLYDGGHYATEAPAIPTLTRRLAAAFPRVRIAVAEGYKGQIIG